ncbi:MAG: disulfide reductase, partial [Deltaproteobacteria bacterium]|nr:disulfide reductase [Deltaproteobacteria bacterium]
MESIMRYALFLGCTIPARARNYELSARKVAEKIGIELVDVNEFICCGFPVKSGDILSATVLGAYNLALARQKDLDLCALCSSCSSALTETDHHLSEDRTLRKEVNDRLASVNLKLEGKTKVRHFARILYEEIGLDSIRKHLQRDLGGLRIAIHYGCHYLKPSRIYDHFDDPEAP